LQISYKKSLFLASRSLYAYLEVDSNFAAGSRAALLHHCLNS
jgi:hypothetical protein